MTTDPLDATAGVPYEAFVELRADCPVSKTASGAYFLARHDDVLAATKNIDAFQASFREPGVVVPPEEQLISEIPEPRHGKIRRIINSAIAQHRIGRVEPFAPRALPRAARRHRRARRRRSRGRVRDADPGHGDRAPPRVRIPRITHTLRRVVRRRRAVHLRRRRTGARTATTARAWPGVAPEFTAYLDAMIAERKASADPPDDFVTRLLHTEVDGRRLTDLEMRTQLAFLLMSGNETTRHLIGNLLETVCTDPALFARLRADRDLVPTVVEESLRHDPPIHVLMRDCLRDADGRRCHDPGRREGRVRPRVGEPRRAHLRRSRRVPSRRPEPEGPPRVRRRSPRLPRRGAGPTRRPHRARGVPRPRRDGTVRRRLPARTRTGVLGQRPRRPAGLYHRQVN